MFIRLGIEDTIKIRCYQLESGKFSEHLEDELHAKYSNKVIPGQGLVIAVRDYEHIGSPFIYPGQGNVHIKVKFGVIVFRPFVDEIMQGSIRFSDPTGMLISTGFFEDVFIPKDELPKPAHFNELEGLWVWKYDENDLYFEQNEMVRFRVTSVRYLDRNGKDEEKDNNDSAATTTSTTSKNQQSLEAMTPVMKVLGSMIEPGLGPPRWWQDEQVEEEQDDEAQMETTD
eukprot:TRINITY_DN4979_c0_g1_i2.p1 TRINITY_DN4979_c0_g1~~TRINITY_DN4979_c0_g1_i2.p1  ORF type:complete len:228 (-),score=67.14 TRINITY_DN4979_c0_g1_i2:1166-1849(-)